MPFNYAQISTNGTCIVISEQPSEIEADHMILLPENINPFDYLGKIYNNGEWTVPNPVAEPPTIPETITRRQFFQQLAIKEIITKVDALAAMSSGKIPTKLEEFVELLPEDQQFNAQMLIIGLDEFHRSSDLVKTFAVMYEWSDEDVQQFWLDASKV